jgi:hypothetical protein
MPKFVNNLDLNKNELRNAVVQVLASAPATPAIGQIYYDSANSTLKVCTATTPSVVFLDLGKQGTVTSVGATAPIQSSGGTTPTISIDAASDLTAGSMSSSHYTLVNNATDTNTASTLVKRDASGNFSAGTITATFSGNLTGNVTGQVSDLSNHDTGDLTEGTNLYYTDARVQANRLDQMSAPTASVTFNSQNITNLADPVNPQDAATKAYVDAARSGLDVKASVRAATTVAGGNITLSGTQTIDDVSLIAGDRVLVKNQSTASENGIWVVAAGAWSRSEDADGTPGAEVTAGMFTFVEQGTTNADSGWVLTTDNPITLGTTGLAFAQFSGAGQIVAGDALSKTGNTLDVNVDSTSIEVFSDALRIASGAAGSGLGYTAGVLSVNVSAAGGLQVSADEVEIKLNTGVSGLESTSSGLALKSNIAGTGLTFTAGVLSVNTIDLTSGTGNGVSGALPIANGGTASTSASAARTALVSDITVGTGVSTPALARVAAKTVGDGSTTSFVIAHNFGTRDVMVQVYVNDSLSAEYGDTVFADVSRSSANEVTVEFAVAPATNEYRVVVTG